MLPRVALWFWAHASGEQTKQSAKATKLNNDFLAMSQNPLDQDESPWIHATTKTHTRRIEKMHPKGLKASLDLGARMLPNSGP
jgi:hypothetical protein